MKIATLLKPSLLQLNETSLSSRVSVRVRKPSKVATDEKTKLERAEKLNRYYANMGFGSQAVTTTTEVKDRDLKSGTVPPAGG